jgi:hypothetical protein
MVKSVLVALCPETALYVRESLAVVSPSDRRPQRRPTTPVKA